MTDAVDSPATHSDFRTGLIPRYLAGSRTGVSVAQRLRWGILGTGNIAKQFATGVAAARRSTVGPLAPRRSDAPEAPSAGPGARRSRGTAKPLRGRRLAFVRRREGVCRAVRRRAGLRDL